MSIIQANIKTGGGGGSHPHAQISLTFKYRIKLCTVEVYLIMFQRKIMISIQNWRLVSPKFCKISGMEYRYLRQDEILGNSEKY